VQIIDARPVCYFHDHHRGDDRISLWCPAPDGVAEALASAEPKRFFERPTSAAGVFSGWLGVYLDGTGESALDWVEVAAIVADVYRRWLRSRSSRSWLVSDVSASARPRRASVNRTGSSAAAR